MIGTCTCICGGSEMQCVKQDCLLGFVGEIIWDIFSITVYACYIMRA